MHCYVLFQRCPLIIIIACVSYSQCQGIYNTSLSNSLQTALLTDYATNTRPSMTTSVDIGFGLSHISKLDNLEQTLGLVGFVLASWNDPRLTWNPSDYGNINEIFFNPSLIWVPALVLSNAASSMTVLSDDSNLASIPIRVDFSGQVIWLAPANLESNCELNIQYYPFDKQSCTLAISAWMYPTGQLDFTMSAFSTVNTDLYVEHGEWSLLSSSVEIDQRTLLGVSTASAEFTLTFSRKYSYYLLNLLLPILFLNALSVLVFILPAGSGEKIGFSLTILLSLSVMITLVSGSIPPTSSHTCILSVYLLMAFGLCSLIVVAVVLNLKIHHLSDQGVQMSERLQRFTRTVLARITFNGRSKKDISNESLGSSKNISNAVDINVSEDGKNILRKTSPIAWEKQEDKEKEYSYADIAVMLDNIFFILFLLLNLIVLLVTVIILISGN